MTLHRPNEDTELGAVSLNKSRVALRTLSLASADGLMIEAKNQPVGADPNRISLREHINNEDLFILLFDNLSLAYIGGTLFRDEALIDGGSSLLSYLVTSPLLDAVVDEKGQFEEEQTAFDANSTFERPR